MLTGLIVCRDQFLDVFEYVVPDAGNFDVEHEKTFYFDESGVDDVLYDNTGGMCYLESIIRVGDSNPNEGNEVNYYQSEPDVKQMNFASRNEAINSSEFRRYEVILFGGKSASNYQWLTVDQETVPPNMLNLYKVSIDKAKTQRFQRKLVRILRGKKYIPFNVYKT